MSIVQKILKILRTRFTDRSAIRDRDAAELFLDTTADIDSDEAMDAYFDFIKDDDANARELRSYNEMWEAVAQIDDLPWPDECELPVRIKKTGLGSRKVSWIVVPSLTVAAAAGIFAAAFFVIPALNQPAPHEAIQIDNFSTARGAHRTLALNDGSTIVLGGDTSIQTRISSIERRVILQKGEAFFQVAPDEARLFYVDAGDVAVQVTGTSFNVQRSTDTVAVSVRSGRVNITVRDNNASPRTLTKGQEVRAAFGGKIGAVRAVDPDGIDAWRRGRLIIDDLPLSVAVASINRYFKGEILIPDPHIRDFRMSGIVNAAEPLEWLQSLEEVLPVQVTPLGGNRYEIRRKSS